MPDTSAADALAVIERLRSTVERTAWPHRTITVSAGCCSWRAGMSKAALFDAADQRLYAAKRAGRNRVVGEAG
ncbi:diguanylate cyclase [Halomonas sp.]|uniref:diguanylate cyclase n=1 Tax=Halomonas sp. TaxID=1486246 RepID=UPI003D1249D9